MSLNLKGRSFVCTLLAIVEKPTNNKQRNRQTLEFLVDCRALAGVLSTTIFLLANSVHVLADERLSSHYCADGWMMGAWVVEQKQQKVTETTLWKSNPWIRVEVRFNPTPTN